MSNELEPQRNRRSQRSSRLRDIDHTAVTTLVASKSASLASSPLISAACNAGASSRTPGSGPSDCRP